MKKYVMSFLVVFLAAAASAFTAVKEDKMPLTLDTYWFPTDDDGNVTSSTTSQITRPCGTVGTVFCSLGYPEDSPYITVSQGVATLNDPSPLVHGIHDVKP